MNAIAGRFAALSPATRGTVWMILGVTALSFMALLVKLLGSGSLHAFQLAFFRALFGLVVLLPFLLRDRGAALRTQRLLLITVRSAVGTVAMLASFFAVTHLPLADAVALSFTKPLFLVIIAALALRETVRWRRWSATGVGFAGVLIMVRPGGAGLDPAVAVALLAAFAVACAWALIKPLSRTERPLTLLAWVAIISTVMTFAVALPVWHAPTVPQLAALLTMGALGVIGQNAIIRAFSATDASAVAPLDYLRLPIAGILAFLVFAEVPGVPTMIGAAVIIVSSVYIARREAALQKPPTPPASAVG